MPRALVAIAFLIIASAGAWGTTTQSAATVPIELVNNFPVVNVSIGDQTVPVMFDLGGSDAIVLTSDVLRSLKVERLSETYAWLDAMGNRLESQKFRIPEVRIGSLAFHAVTGHEDAEAATYRKTPGGSGYIGPALIASFKLVVDYGKRQMTFIPNDVKKLKAHGCFGTEIRFDPDMEGAPVTKIKSDVGEHRFIWDTGAPKMIVRRSLVTALGIVPDGDVFQSKTFELGGKEFGPMQLYMFDFGEPTEVGGFVGFDFFARNVVCIDIQGGRFFVHPNTP